jgi:hypothetical protein
MGRPEFWWCVKRDGRLRPETARRLKEMIEKVYEDEWGVGIHESVVRIRVEEAPGKGRRR